MARILVIEDNFPNRELIVYLLNAFHHTPIEAEDGEAGLEAAHRERPDLILCDLQLPKIDGYALARHFKADEGLQEIPLVAVTASSMVGDREKIISAGFDGYISKPIDPETFVARVETFLRRGIDGDNPRR